MKMIGFIAFIALLRLSKLCFILDKVVELMILRFLYFKAKVKLTKLK